MRNAGVVAVQPGAAGVTGPFTYASDCPNSLPVGDVCQVHVTFHADDVGPANGVFTMGGTSGVKVSLHGHGYAAGAALALSTTSLNFEDTTVGQSAGVRAVTLTNNSGNTMSLSGIGVTADGADFAQSNNCGAALPNGASCEVRVAFTPAVGGARVSNLSIYDNATSSLYSVALQGTGLASALRLTPASVTFASTVVGSPVQSTVAVKNTGNAAARSLAAAVTSGTAFKLQSTTCTTMLAVDASCDLVVAFDAAAAGAQTGTLSVEAAGVDTLSVPLSATAAAQELTLTAQSTLAAFDDTAVGATSVVQAVTVTNTGNVPVQVAAVSALSVENAYAQANNCGGPLNVGASCQVNLTFAPTHLGAHPGRLVLTYGPKSLEVVLQATGLQGSLHAAASTLELGTAVVGVPASRTLALTNEGNAPLALSAAQATPDEFTVDSTNCPATLAAQQGCTVTVTFAPTAAGARTGQLTLTSAVNTVVVSLTGQSTKPAISVTPENVSFSPVQVGATAPTKTLSVRNTGSAPLTVSAIGFTAGASDFAQANDCSVVAVGASCSITVNFTPSQAGTRTATLVLTHDGDDGVSVVSLTGQSQLAEAVLSVPTFSASVAGSSSTATAVLTNSGIGAVSVTPPDASSVSGTGFSLTGTTCSPSLPAGASCNIVIAFTPTANGAFSGTLGVMTEAGSRTTALVATGLQGVALLSATQLTFIPQQTSTSSAQSVTLTNTGNRTLGVQSAAVTQGNGDFSVSNTCSSVAPGANCTVTVAFTPTASGTRTGVVTLTHDGAGATSLALTGTGAAPSATLNAPSFANTKVGASSTAAATLTNTGVGPLSVTPLTSASVTGTDLTYVSADCPASLAVAQSCAITVRFSPTSTAARHGTLTVTTGAGVRTASLDSVGIQGYASMSPAELTFAPAQTGQTSAPQTVTVTNTGTDDLTFTGVGVATGGTDFGQSNNCGVVAVGQTCVVSVAFTPSASSTRTGTLGFAHNGGGLAMVNLTGQGAAPAGTLTNVAFGNVRVGTSANGTASLRNTGIGPLTVSAGAQVQGAGFTLGVNSCPSSLAANATCSVTVSYSPAAAQSHTGQFTVTTGAGALTSTLVGAGIQGVASVSPSSLSFATRQVATTSPVQAVTVNNSGSDTVTISGISVVAGQMDFAQSNNCTQLAPGASCTVNVSFTPSQAGARTGTVYLAHDGLNGSTQVSLSGPGQAASATLSSPVFATTQLGNSTTATATLTNTGLSSISVTPPAAAAMTGAGFAFALTDCTATLAANASCSTVVTFAPVSSAGARTGQLAIDTGAGTITTTLSATATAPSLVAISSPSLGVTLPPMTQSGTNLFFKNNGYGNVTITAAASGSGDTVAYAPSAAYCYPGVVVAPNQTCAVYAYASKAAGDYAGTITVPSTAGNVSQALTATVKGVLGLGTAAFGNVPMGTTSDQTVTLSNTASVAARNLTYTPTAPFSIVSNNCSATLAGNGSCSMTVRFTPAAVGPATGTGLTVTGAYAQTSDGTEYPALLGTTQTLTRSFTATATTVDYSGNLTSYVNTVSPISLAAAWSDSMGSTWYSLNAGGANNVQAGTFQTGMPVLVPGSTPVQAKLRLMADDAMPAFKVNGQAVSLPASMASGNASNYQSTNESVVFTLQPGINSLETTYVNGGSGGGFIAEVWSSDGTTKLAASSNWKYSGAAQPVLLYSSSGAMRYADNTTAPSCRGYRSPATGYSTASADGVYSVTPGTGTVQVLCSMSQNGGGWTLVLTDDLPHFTNAAGTGTSTICLSITGCNTGGTSTMYLGTAEEARIYNFMFTSTTTGNPWDASQVLTNPAPFIRDTTGAPGISLFKLMTDTTPGWSPAANESIAEGGDRNDGSRMFYDAVGTPWSDGNWHGIAGQEGMQLRGGYDWGHHHFTSAPTFDGTNYTIYPWTYGFFDGTNHLISANAAVNRYRWTVWVR